MKRLVTIILLVSSALFAEPFSHDELFANAALGLGYASFENADGEESLTANGFSVKFHGKLGYYVVQNLALHADLGYVMYSNFREARYGIPIQVKHELSSLTSVFVGAGVTYYVPEWHNVFVSGSLGVTGYEMDCRKMKGSTGLRAFSFDVGVGKEWWVSESVGLGVSASFDSGEYWSDRDGVFRSSSFMLLFSITYD